MRRAESTGVTGERISTAASAVSPPASAITAPMPRPTATTISNSGTASLRITSAEASALAVAGVAPEVVEGGHRPVRRRVAEPSRGPDGGGAGVVGVGHGQLGGGEDGLAGDLRQVGGGLGEPGVLALVVLHDPLEAVVRVEAA